LGHREEPVIDFSLVPKFQGENFYANKKIAENFKALAQRKGCSVTQVALAWVAAEGIIAIPGTTRPERLVENFASRDIELTEEDKREMRAVIEASKPQGDRYSKEASKAIGN
jgi:aryl-alcohol dehydrogenase-like predicted oxidoreductase